LFHKPSKKTLPGIKQAGVTMVVSLLAEREDGASIKKMCEEAGMTHVWLKHVGASEEKLLDPAALDLLRNGFIQVMKMMNSDQHKTLIHCSAGLHRTGISGYTLLRMQGFNQLNAYKLLAKMRVKTYEGVGKWRLNLAEEYIVKWILEREGENLPPQELPEKWEENDEVE